MDQSTNSNATAPVKRLRENVWHVYREGDRSYFQTTDGTFEVPTSEALEFIKIRPHFSGCTTLDEIAARSGVPKQRVADIARSLDEAQLFQGSVASDDERAVRERLSKVTAIWSKELTSLYIANKLLANDYSKTILVGWLCEMYHYVKSFPAVIQVAADGCQDPETRAIIQEYANQERGHEGFVLQTLVNLGLKEQEVRRSNPLPSTQLITFLMRKLFEISPTMVFAMASLVESQEWDDSNSEAFKQQMGEKFGISADALTPFLMHQKIDTEMGHGTLLARHLQRIDVSNLERFSEAINVLHDLKHAFELQTAEIESYYGGDLQGRYMPRLAMEAAAL